MFNMGNFLDSNPISGLVSGAVGAIDSIFGISQRRQENAQKRLMEQQQQYWNQQNEILYNQQVEQWNRENEYNDPTNAYKRLLDGAEANGLSKAQVLNGAGSQVQSQGASGVSAPGSVATPSTSGAPVYSMGQGVMSSMRQLAEIDLMESEAEKNRSSVGLQDAQIGYYNELIITNQVNQDLMRSDMATKEQLRISYELDNEAKRINNGYLDKLNKAELEKVWAEVSSIKVNVAYREKELGTFDREFEQRMSLQKEMEKLYIVKQYAERMLGDMQQQDARYKSIRNETIEQVFEEELRQLQISGQYSHLQGVASGSSGFGGTIMTWLGYGISSAMRTFLDKCADKSSK